uniref:Uncharacterized protein n=1 Tax=Zymomonas mobilis subsp. mobilis (strain ATCC 31821 / ZM4 / CP4) TaxID=264203 RepID=Q8GF58_ZYMMO|nr:unknown [Zymomonas mobilis subsp. mobilis ZM4 = ATCC 31821]
MARHASSETTKIEKVQQWLREEKILADGVLIG